MQTATEVVRIVPRRQGVIASRLASYRQELEQGTAPESWAEVELTARGRALMRGLLE